jgi:hypothetical protein
MSLLDLECGDDISSENESGEESENSEDLKMFDDKTDTKGVEHQKVYDVKDRQLQENADDMDAAAYLQHLEQIEIESREMEKHESIRLENKRIERRKKQKERNTISSDEDDARDVTYTSLDFTNSVLGSEVKADGMQSEEQKMKTLETDNDAIENDSDCRGTQEKIIVEDVYSDESELHIESDESEDEQVAEAVDVFASGVQPMTVQHHSASCTADVNQSITCDLYHIDMVLDWKECKTTRNGGFKCVVKRADFIYLGDHSSGFGEMHKCGSITCGACIVAQNSEKPATWDELAVSTPWARTASALLELLHNKFECWDRISFIRRCVDLDTTEVNQLLESHAAGILPAMTLSAKPILEAVQLILKAQLATFPRPNV